MVTVSAEDNTPVRVISTHIYGTNISTCNLGFT